MQVLSLTLIVTAYAKGPGKGDSVRFREDEELAFAAWH